ncbi:HAD domain-containing protein [Ammoniphilus resinae]|uniref:NAD(P)H-dependent FMN reductase n=1 Tax=Ammoniphilus resinae TaxID=861532 RepID=A0ABS4GLQ9_9BACL|nr:HAD domain-containing protein [Ammoniphilus resinae]MBP1931047.1 NAD(P)H-dependent FMN reductase [Ammoniphilus resinae]
MKVIFLDLDGVMITGSNQKLSSEYDGYVFTPTSVEHLKQIIDQTGAFIVVTSTYRKAGFSYLKKMFEANGITEGLIGQTPVLAYHSRGREIQQYIDESQLDPSLTVEKFVIIDDHDDMGELMPFLVQTKWHSGLDEEAKNKAIQMLLD